MSEKQTEVLELIRWLDKQRCKLFKWYDVFLSYWSILLPLIFLLVVVELFLLGNASDTDKFGVALSFSAFVVTIFAFMAQFGKKEIVKRNFNKVLKLKRDFNTNQKILLKALIKIKAENPEFDLEETYNKNKSMFTPEKLMEKLYE